jgi:hypothetical protein
MANNTAAESVVQLDSSNQVGREHREVYAHAGVGLSQAQILEGVLKYFVVIATAIERRTAEPPITADDVTSALADIEKFES